MYYDTLNALKKMSVYEKGEWRHEAPTCPTCCAVRARQGFETPAVLGDDCEPCKAAKEAAIYYASDAYKAELEKMKEAVQGVIMPGEAGLPPAVDTGMDASVTDPVVVADPQLDYGMGL